MKRPAFRTLLCCCSILSLAACAKPSSKEPAAGSASPEHPTAAAAPSAEAEATTAEDTSHRVVFADRISHTYLLLVEGQKPPAISRESLVALARSKLLDAEAKPELDLLVKLIETEPPVGPLTDQQRRDDLLGLHLDVLPIADDGGRLIEPEMWTDPILVRELDARQRASLSKRRHVIVLRAEYRNQYALRGLRLFQTLVQLTAQKHDALVFDPDTGETVDADAFAERKLRSSRANIADQVAVVPFSDPRHGGDTIRLSTRGMRKFGSVDLELDGLPKDPRALQAATHLMYGLAYTMMHLGEYDSRGYAVEVGDSVTLERAHVDAAYGPGKTPLAPCPGCTSEVELHLVERPSEPHDPQDHVVARVVAPREQSDRADYDHRAWVASTLGRLVGP